MLFLQYLNILKIINPKKCLNEFLDYPFIDIEDKSKIDTTLYLKIRKSIKTILFTGENTKYIVSKLSKIQPKSWKEELVNNILYENEELNFLLDEINSLNNANVKEEGNYTYYYQILYAKDFDFYMHKNKPSQLFDNSLYDWKLITEVAINKIIKKEKVTEEKSSKNNIIYLLNSIAKDNNYFFNSFLYDAFHATLETNPKRIIFKNNEFESIELYNKKISINKRFQIFQQKHKTQSKDSIKKILIDRKEMVEHLI